MYSVHGNRVIMGAPHGRGWAGSVPTQRNAPHARGERRSGAARAIHGLLPGRPDAWAPRSGLAARCRTLECASTSGGSCMGGLESLVAEPQRDGRHVDPPGPDDQDDME